MVVSNKNLLVGSDEDATPSENTESSGSCSSVHVPVVGPPGLSVMPRSPSTAAAAAAAAAAATTIPNTNSVINSVLDVEDVEDESSRDLANSPFQYQLANPEGGCSFLMSMSQEPAPPTYTTSCLACKYVPEPDPEEVDHVEHGRKKVQSSNVTAFVTLLKALFGVSLLSSPKVLGETGLVLGTIVYSLILMACMGSCWCLLQARAMVVIMEEREKEGQESTPTDTASVGSARPVTAITYGDLGEKLLGPKQKTMIDFLIVSLHVCFGAGLVSSSMHQLAIVLGWEEDYDKYDSSSSSGYNNYDNQSGDQDNYYNTSNSSEEVWLRGRLIMACIFFPIIAILLQFRNVKDLFWVCLVGIVVFVVGCIGTMFYSAAMADSNGDGSNVWEIPEDAFAWRWSGVPNFVASTLCAMEGINLALPIANQFLLLAAATEGTVHASVAATAIGAKFHAAINNSPIPVITSAVGFFGFTTLSVAYFGYLSGLGGSGSASSSNNDDGDDDQDCTFVAHCLDSKLLENIHRISLATTLILTLPIILYPSLELLERWAEERYQQLKTGLTATNEKLGNTWTGFVCGEPPESLRRKLHIEETLYGREPFFPFLHRHWRFRIGHATAVCLLAVVDRQWERGLVLFKGIGLSIACLILPVILFVQAYSIPFVLSKPMLAAALTGLMTLGLVNFVLVNLSVFTKHNFLPTEIHDDPMHHGHRSGDHASADHDRWI